MEALHADITRKLSVLVLLHIALFTFHLAKAAAAPATNQQPQPVAALCNSTTNARLCLVTLSKYPSSKPSVHLQDLTAYVVAQALVEVNRTYTIGKQLAAHEDAAGDKFTLQDCLELLDDAVERLKSSVNGLSKLNASSKLPGSLRGQIMDVRVWLSSSYTDLDTCWDELSDPKLVAPFKTSLGIINQKIEPLLAIALSLAQTLEGEGGVSTSYALPRQPLAQYP